MVSVLLKALGAILVKLFAAMATEVLLEWLLFKVAQLLVDSTKTKHDNEFLKKLKEAYEEGKEDK